MIDEETKARTQELTDSNGARIQQLAGQGVRLDIHQLMMRHLIETLFPEPEQQAELNLAFQEKLDKVLDDAESHLDSINLQRSAQQAAGLIVPRND